MDNEESLRAAGAAELAGMAERDAERAAAMDARFAEWQRKAHEAHVRAGKAAAAKRWAGHSPAQETVTRRVYRVDDELLRCFGRGPLAIHRLLMATEGIFWARRPGDGCPVPLEALKRVPCIPPAPEEASGLPAWACVRRKRRGGG